MYEVTREFAHFAEAVGEPTSDERAARHAPVPTTRWEKACCSRLREHGGGRLKGERQDTLIRADVDGEREEVWVAIGGDEAGKREMAAHHLTA